VDPPFGASNAYIEMAFMHVWARDRLQAAGAVRMSRVILEAHAAIMANQAIDGSAFDLSAACNHCVRQAGTGGWSWNGVREKYC